MSDWEKDYDIFNRGLKMNWSRKETHGSFNRGRSDCAPQKNLTILIISLARVYVYSSRKVLYFTIYYYLINLQYLVNTPGTKFVDTNNRKQSAKRIYVSHFTNLQEHYKLIHIYIVQSERLIVESNNSNTFKLSAVVNLSRIISYIFVAYTLAVVNRSHDQLYCCCAHSR